MNKESLRFLSFDDVWKMRIDHSLIARDGDLLWSCGQCPLDGAGAVLDRGDSLKQATAVAGFIRRYLARVECIQSAPADAKVVTPIDAAIKGLHAFGAHRISLLMPYLASTASMVAEYMESSGFTLDAVATLDLNGEPEMNRVDPDCIFEEAVRLFDPRSDALFISCTGWLTHKVIERLEKELGKPVISSNQALAWQALREAGVADSVAGQGRLFSSH